VSRAEHVTATRLAALRWSLDDEDWAVLHDVARMRVAAALDLQALHGLRQELRVRPFRHLLKGMADRGVLTRMEGRSIGGKKAGSAGFVYVVGPAGQRLLAREESQPVRRTWAPRPSWLKHALAVAHLYVDLRQLEHRDLVKLQAFDSEPGCWRSFRASAAASVLKPDAYVEVAVGEFVDSYFIEVDCGTESPSTLARKFDTYAAYWQSGVEQRRRDVFPRVLWLAPTEKRRDVIAVVAARQPTTAQALHRVATYARFADVITGQPP
jgi:hypothetical protein